MYVEHSSYHTTIFNPKKLKRAVSKTVALLRKLQPKLKFDAIAFRGQSGAGVAYPVSIQTGVPLVLVRKNESSHGYDIEGPNKIVKRYIIIDDFVSTGATVRAITRALGLEGDCKCVGIVAYDKDNFKKDVLDHKKRKLIIYNAIPRR